MKVYRINFIQGTLAIAEESYDVGEEYQYDLTTEQVHGLFKQIEQHIAKHEQHEAHTREHPGESPEEV